MPSPHDLASEHEDREIYEHALEQLSDNERELIIARLEFQLPYEELAVTLKRRNAQATRVASRRAVVKLANTMQRLRTARQN